MSEDPWGGGGHRRGICRISTWVLAVSIGGGGGTGGIDGTGCIDRGVGYWGYRWEYWGYWVYLGRPRRGGGEGRHTSSDHCLTKERDEMEEEGEERGERERGEFEYVKRPRM